MAGPIVQTAIRRVVRLGNPVLRRQARELCAKEVQDIEVQRLIEEMAVTMIQYAGVGLAAPQVGQGLALFVMGLPEEGAPPDEALELSVVINPKLRFLGSEKEADWEGCLSVPGLRGEVPRFKKLELSGLDQRGKAFTRRFEGFPARVVQHEFDHLQGKVYLDRMPELSSLAFTDEHVRV